jgi:hypothetical protein
MLTCLTWLPIDEAALATSGGLAKLVNALTLPATAYHRPEVVTAAATLTAKWRRLVLARSNSASIATCTQQHGDKPPATCSSPKPDHAALREQRLQVRCAVLHTHRCPPHVGHAASTWPPQSSGPPHTPPPPFPSLPPPCAMVAWGRRA